MNRATELLRMAVVPREGYFCNDGRGWQSHWTGRGNALAWPWPTTIAGALRSAWGRKDEEQLGRTYTRPDWLALAGEIRLGAALPLWRSWRGSRGGREAWRREHLAWPAPADALAVGEGGERRVVALRPRPLAGAFGAQSGVLGRDESAATDLLWLALPDRETQLGKPAREPAWWSDARFRAWLRGAELGPAGPEDAFDFPRRFQVHVRIDPGTQTAEEHFLYAHDQVETLARAPGVVYEWALAVEVEAPGEPPARIRLGSDGRLAAVEPLEPDLYRPPDELLRAFEEEQPRGLRLVAVTPLVFSGGWLPDGLEEEGARFAGELLPGAGRFVLRAAVVGRPLAVSGWDMAAGGPKMTIRAVPQGSVYFFERADGRPFGWQDAERFWLAALGSRTEDGFGRVVPGIWRGSDERGDDDETRRRTG